MKQNRIVITYCTRCRWMLRATWVAQELLTTFDQELSEVTLRPDHSGGVFIIADNEQVVFSKQESTHFPELKTVKQMIRDVIAPDKSLGHSDRTEPEK